MTGVDVEHTKAHVATARELHANFYDVNNSKPLSAISRAAIDRLPVLANELDALVAAVERSKHCTSRSTQLTTAYATEERSPRSAQAAGKTTATGSTGPAPQSEHWKCHEHSIVPLLLNN